ncbi:hypothetical protein [Kitasatospora sp. NPDC059673]|uniref:hypothetical protein n=1 Tax=Kitasatospora sp. NPDC059673 TaxID=3346901 RepID=UPI0036A9F4B2
MPSESTPEGRESTPEGREPISFATKAKNLAKKHKRKLLVAGGALGLVVLAVVVAPLAEGREAEDAEDPEPLSGPEPTDERRSLRAYDVDPHLRKLPEGQNASEEKKAQYKQETGNDLPADSTWVDGWSHQGDPPKDADPGEAAA